MPIVTITEKIIEQVRDLSNSKVIAAAIENAFCCDGLICRLATLPEQIGNVPRHSHLILKAKYPAAGPRWYPILIAY